MIILSDNNYDQKQNLISIITKKACSQNLFNSGHFENALKSIKLYDDGIDAKSSDGGINDTINKWLTLSADFIQNKKLNFDDINLIIPASLLSLEKEIDLSQYLITIRKYLDEIYENTINEIIAYDRKSCVQLTRIIKSKTQEMFSEVYDRLKAGNAPLNATLTSSKTSHGSNNVSLKFQKYHDELKKNFISFAGELKRYFDCEIFEIKFRDNGENLEPAGDHFYEFEDFKISAEYALNILKKFCLQKKASQTKIAFFTSGEYRYAALRLDYNYPLIKFDRLCSLILIKTKDELTSRDEIFIETALKVLIHSNDKTYDKINATINSVKNEILNKLTSPCDTSRNLNEYFDALFKIICAACGADYSIFICADGLETEDSVKSFGFSPPDSSVLNNRLAPIHLKIIKKFSESFHKKQNALLKLDTQELKSFIEEITTLDNCYINKALAAPFYQEDALKGVIILLSKKPEPLFDESELIIETTNSCIINLLCSCLACYKLKKENSDFNAKVEDTINDEKMKLLAAISTGIAHHFNNLMAVILGRVGLLQRSITDEKSVASLKIIENALKNGEDIIKRLQAFIPKKSVNSGYTLTDVNKLIDEIVEITKMRMYAECYLKNIRIEVKTRLEPLPQIFINSGEIHEALLNVAFNAIEAMPNGGEIVFRSYIQQNYIYISVKDNGVGMSKEIQQKAFTPFFTTKGQIGTGLNLSYAYGVILKHQGNIVIKSSIGRGTELIIKLPANVENTEIKSRLDDISKIDYKSKIIIIDDHKTIREALSEIIRTLGHIPFSVSNGSAAFELLDRDDKYDFVFTDYKMPDYTGAEIAKKIRKKYPHIFIIMVTAYSYGLDEMELETGTIDAIIGKPFNIVTIENTINAALDKKLSGG